MAINPFYWLIVLMLIVTTATNANKHLQYNADGAEVCIANKAFGGEEDCATKHAKIGQVDPSEIRKMEIYDDWENGTISLKGEKLAISRGAITWPAPLERRTEFSVLPGLLSQKTINKVLSLLDKRKNPKATEFDTALDTVDAMPTREIYLHEGESICNRFEKSLRTTSSRDMIVNDIFVSNIWLCEYCFQVTNWAGVKKRKGKTKSEESSGSS